MSTDAIGTRIWHAVRWVARTILVVFLLCLLFTPLALLALPDINWQELRVPVSLSSAWLVLVGVAAALLVVHAAWRTIRVVLFAPFGSWQTFGGTSQARLIGLGITVLFVPRGIIALVNAPLTLVLQLLERLPRTAVRVPLSTTSSGSSPDATYSLREPLVQLSGMTMEVLAEVARAMQRLLEQVVVPEVAIALAAWAIAGNMLTIASSVDSGTASAGRSRLRRYIDGMSSSQQYALGLAAVFLFGAYLSVAAIVAIPWLHEEKVAPELSREGLEKILNGILPSSSTPYEEMARTILVAQESPLARLSELQTAKSVDDIDLVRFSLVAATAEALELRQRAIAVVKEAPAQLSQRAAQLKTAALTAFDLETATAMSSQERGYFIREIQRSVTTEFAQYEGAFRACTTALVQAEAQFREIGRAPRASAVAASANVSSPDSRNWEVQLQVGILARRLDSATRILREACEEPQAIPRSVFAPPEPGSGWGPFGSVARWLLQTKSFALTLITGMLGFGLLGAVMTTLVRADGSTRTTLTAEVISVVVRGLAAAVVVFLAVKGGLAVFSAGEAEPNAYVVFFTCLVGAVFSEDVWKWARTKFLGNLDRSLSAKQATDVVAPETLAHSLTARSGTAADTNKWD